VILPRDHVHKTGHWLEYGSPGRRRRGPNGALSGDSGLLATHNRPWRQRWRATLGAMLVLGSLAAPDDARAGQLRTYLPDPADEDWSFLKGTPKSDFWDPMKYIPLAGEDWFMTLSGQLRYRPEGFRIRRTETSPDTSDNYLLQRYLFGADVHFGARARIFGEVQSGVINGRLRSPRPTDRNAIDLHQAFFEWRQPAARERQVSLKVGRQELAIGSTRLISASPGLNVKRSFDGAAISYRAPGWTLSGAAARLVGLKSGAFDDRSDAGQVFWGAAVSRLAPRLTRGEIGAYYLGVDRALSLYAQGLGPEVRHTIGAKWTGAGERLTLNWDVLFQWGTFARAPIRAWAFATETTYRVSSAGWRPRLSIRGDIASGDVMSGDARLQSFNPLFPGNSYSGSVGLLGPTNLTDLTPAVTLSPRPTLTVGIEAPSYWRTSSGDGVYGTDLRLLIPSDAGAGHYVGTNPGVLFVWQATTHWQLQAVVTRFLPGRFLDRTFFSSGFGFYSGSVIYRF
jgi:hypothetical protein